MNAPVLVADFDLRGAKPNARDLVDAAVARGAQFVAVDVVDGDETAEAHVADRRVSVLERLVTEARRGGIGIVLRLRDTLAIASMRDAIGVVAGVSAGTLRERLLVVVGTERAGKRLRREAPELPSAYEMPATPGRSLSRLLPPNFRRAAADADDLVVPWGRIEPAKLARTVAPDLARRGARLRLSGVEEADLAKAVSLPAAGVIVRCTLAGPRLGV